MSYWFLVGSAARWCPATAVHEPPAFHGTSWWECPLHSPKWWLIEGVILGKGEKEALWVISICSNGNSCEKKNVLHPSLKNEELKLYKRQIWKTCVQWWKALLQVLHMSKHTAEPNLTGISASITEIITYTCSFAQVFIICWALFSVTVCILTIHRTFEKVGHLNRQTGSLNYWWEDRPEIMFMAIPARLWW